MTKTQATEPPRPPGNRWVLPAAGVLLVAMVALAIVAFSGSGGNTARRSARQTPPVVTDALQVTVEVGDNWFKPPSLQIKKGATVTWEFKGKVPHNVTEDLDLSRENFASNTMVSGTFAHTFDIAGTFYYYCTVHHVMQGQVAVSE